MGRTLRPAEQTHMTIPEQRRTAQAMAFQYLATCPRTAHEVRQHLHRRGVADAVIEHVIEALYTQGALDDTAYTRAYLTTRLAGRGYGPQRLHRELHRRGVSRARVEEVAQQVLTAQDVLTAARRQAAQRWPRLTREPDHAKRRQKLFAFLRRRGFSTAVAQQVTLEVVQDTASGDHPRQAN